MLSLVLFLLSGFVVLSLVLFLLSGFVVLSLVLFLLSGFVLLSILSIFLPIIYVSYNKYSFIAFWVIFARTFIYANFFCTFSSFSSIFPLVGVVLYDCKYTPSDSEIAIELTSSPFMKLSL